MVFEKTSAGTAQGAGRILYRSSNGISEPVDFKTVLLRGQAPDGGLYMPTRIPGFGLAEIELMRGRSYSDIAFKVMYRFLDGEMGPCALRRMTNGVYCFPVTLKQVYDRKYLLWLDGGPTLSFKDFATGMMSRLVQYYIRNDGRNLTILTATSGDTGSAVAAAFHKLENIECVILFPKSRVTEIQRRQMTTLRGNIKTFAVDGSFDDCQAMVKQAFSDPELRELNLSSANSINVGRLLPQIVQYFYAYSKVADGAGEKLVVSVPCGNFGHITAGVLAKRMGLPVERFVVATNANDEFPRFMETGRYMPVIPSKDCISNAMSVGHPSNLIRIIGLYGGEMDASGRITTMPDMGAMKREIFAVSISDDETRRTMKEVYANRNIMIEPHGAVAWAGLMSYLRREGDWNPCVSFETANPGKFQDEILRTVGVEPELPPVLRKLGELDESFETIPNDYGVFKRALMQRRGRGAQG
jgi:threonine synthase